MEFKKINFQRPSIEEDDELISSKEGKFSDGRPFIEEAWTYEHITGMTIFTYPDGFKIAELYEKGKKFESEELNLVKDVLVYLENEGYPHEKLFARKGVNVICINDDDNAPFLSINIILGMD